MFVKEKSEDDEKLDNVTFIETKIFIIYGNSYSSLIKWENI